MQCRVCGILETGLALSNMKLGDRHVRKGPEINKHLFKKFYICHGAAVKKTFTGV
jgi:hypothetical protein